MILFPSRPDRIFLLSFWLSLVISTGLLFLILLSYLDASRLFFLGLILIFIFFLIGGYFLPNIMSVAYNAWRNAAGLFVRLSRIVLMAVYFYIAFIFIGRGDLSKSLKRSSSKTSMWSPWITPEQEVYSEHLGVKPIKSYHKHWIYSFIKWGKKPRHIWAFSLLPFILLFRILQTDQKSSFPANIYTLY